MKVLEKLNKSVELKNLKKRKISTNSLHLSAMYAQFPSAAIPPLLII